MAKTTKALGPADHRPGKTFKTPAQMKRPTGHKFDRGELADMSQDEFEVNRDAIEAQMRTSGIPIAAEGAA